MNQKPTCCSNEKQDALDNKLQELEDEIAELEDKIDSIEDSGHGSGIGEGYDTSKSCRKLKELLEEAADVARERARCRRTP